MADVDNTSESAPTSSCSTAGQTPPASTSSTRRDRSHHRKRKKHRKHRSVVSPNYKTASVSLPASVEESVSLLSPRTESEARKADDAHDVNDPTTESSTAQLATVVSTPSQVWLTPPSPLSRDRHASNLEISAEGTFDISLKPSATKVVLPITLTSLDTANSTVSLTAPSNVQENKVKEPVVVRLSSADIRKQNPIKAPTLNGVKLESLLTSVTSGAGRINSLPTLYCSAASHDEQRSVRERPAEKPMGLVCLLCLAMGALATSVSMALLVFWWRKQDSTEPCVGFDCQLAIRYLRSLVDPDIPPCDDFYGHVCHKWEADEGGLSFVDAAVRDLALALNWTILSISFGRDSYYGAGDFVRFYASCHEFLARTSDRTSREQEIHLPPDLFTDESSILDIREPATLLARVSKISLTRGISSAFGLSLVRHRGVLAVYISRGSTLAEKLGERNQTRMMNRYLKAIFGVVKTLLRNSTWFTLEDMGSLFSEFEFCMVRPQRHLAAHALEQLQVSALDAIVEIVGSDWLSILNSGGAADPPLTNGSLVLADCLECLNATVRSFNAQVPYAAAYVYSHVLTEVGQFIYKSKEFAPKRAANAPAACLSASRDVLPPLWSHLYSNLSYSAASSDTRTTNIFERIVPLATQALVGSSAYVGNFEHRTPTALSFPDVSTADVFLYNATLESMSNSNQSIFNGIDEKLWADFPSLYLAAKEREVARRLRQPITSDYAVESALLLRGRVTYHPLQRAVVLPAAMRRLPMTYPESVPVEFELGTVGTLLATELLRVAALSVVSQKKQLWKEWYKESTRRFVDCTEDVIVRSLTTFGRERVENDAFELYVWSRAFRVALDTLAQYYPRKSARGTPAAQRWLSALRTFFVRFCLLSCGSGTLGSGVGRKLRCLLPALSASEFRYAFGCKSFRRKSACESQ